MSCERYGDSIILHHYDMPNETRPDPSNVRRETYWKTDKCHYKIGIKCYHSLKCQHSGNVPSQKYCKTVWMVWASKLATFTFSEQNILFLQQQLY